MKALFVAKGSTIVCTVCKTADTFIPMQQNINRVQCHVWEQYLAAVTEAAVIAEQKRGVKPHLDVAALQVSKPPSPLDIILSDLERLTLPSCSQCQQVLPDFDGCLALVCGRTTGGSVGFGCGSHLCGYCQQACDDEWAVHRHLKFECVMNPRPNEMFPGKDLKEILAAAARERVWWHVMIRAETPQVDEVFSMANEKWPELGMTEAWSAKRLRWTLLCGEMQADPLTFSKQLPVYMRCEAHCVGMGFPEDAAMRAAVLHKGDVTQACIALLENQ